MLENGLEPENQSTAISLQHLKESGNYSNFYIGSEDFVITFLSPGKQ